MDENFYSHILSVSNKHPLFLKYILRTVEISPLQGWDRGVGKIVGGALKKGDYHLCSPKFFLALCFSVCVYLCMLVYVCVALICIISFLFFVFARKRLSFFEPCQEICDFCKRVIFEKKRHCRSAV